MAPAAAEILGRRLRANPRFELILFDRLSAEEQHPLRDLTRDAGFYGVLRPGGESPGLTVKSADRDTALLFLTLREPGLLPSYVRSQLGAAAESTLARLVADGVLEVEVDDRWMSGPAFLGFARRLGDSRETGEPERGEGRIAALSAAALRYGQALSVDDPHLLAWRLYSYNRCPLTPAWQRLLPGPAEVKRWLGIDREGSHRKALAAAWTPLAMDGWLGWQARSRAGASGSGGVGGMEGRAGESTWKLYVSARPEALAAGFGDVLAALTAARAFQFKIGRDAGGLLRPDKIVAYFPSWESLAAAADAVLQRLDGAPAQGVPFSAEIGGGGLLSWGVDPPDGERSGLGGERESWRVWVVQRLAWALLAARNEPGRTAEPWRFALERIGLEGVDTASWTPSAALWKD